MRIILVLLVCSAVGTVYAAPDLGTGIMELPQDALSESGHQRYMVFGQGPAPILGEAVRSLHTGGGFFTIAVLDESSLPLLQGRGYGLVRDFKVDLHSNYTDATGLERLVSSGYAVDLGYTGKGITVGVVDTGVDFSNPDLMHAVARDENNWPLMLDADGQGLVITNATFTADIDEYGMIRNSPERSENFTSVVYVNHDGVFLDIRQGGKDTSISVYNSLYPQSGPAPVFSGTLDDDMRIGASSDDYIRSASGVYRLGVIYQGALSGTYTGLQTIPVLVVDSIEPGVYDTIIPDLSTAWADHTRFDLPRGQEPEYDFDFTDETPIILGGGYEFLVYDGDGDGTHDYTAGTVGARVLDVYGVIGTEPHLDDQLGVLNGTLLPPLDPDGEFFGVMTDFVGHGTSSAGVIASKGIHEYHVYNETDSHQIRGVAPDAAILPIKALWFGDTVYASLWAAGFDNPGSGWEFTGRPRVDILSNSWGVSAFPLLGAAPGVDLLSMIHGALVTPRSLDAEYPGILVVSSAGNSGHGYGTISPPGASPLAVSVGASTNNVFVGYGQFEGQPRFGNSTIHAGHLADFSSRGPGVVGDPKPDIISTGAYGFVPAQVTNQDGEPFSLFGGTSMAAPLVSGGAAVLMQALHEDGQNYDPSRVKSILVSSAADMNNDALSQGAGLLDVGGAVGFVHGEPGRFIVYNDASYANLREVLEGPYDAANHTAFGVDRFALPEGAHPQPAWFGGHLYPGQRSTAHFTIENPSSEPLILHIEAEQLELVHHTVYSGNTIPHQTDPVLQGTDVYAPNYIRLEDIRQYLTLASYFEGASAIPDDSTLLVLRANFGFDQFMNSTDPIFANDMQISSLYLYDWTDSDDDAQVSSDELALVNRAGSWGTVQEMRVSDPAGQFSGVPLVGVYPVPMRHSYWSGPTGGDAVPMEYDLTAEYYSKSRWGLVWPGSSVLEVPPASTAQMSATIVVPQDMPTGVYQGFLSFEGMTHTAAVPVSFAVKHRATPDGPAMVQLGSPGDAVFGSGHIGGAFDMTDRYMTGDWRQFYFEVEDPTLNTGIFEVSWEDPSTHLSLFAVDPDGMLIQSSVPAGVFESFADWPSSDWLGVTPFSQGGGFYPVSGDEISAAIRVPINQTGTYSILAHAGLFGGNSTTEGISVVAKFTNIPRLGDAPAQQGIPPALPPGKVGGVPPDGLPAGLH